MCCCVTLSARLQTMSGAGACIALTFDTEAKKLSEGEVCAITRRVCNRQKSAIVTVRKVCNTCNS